ncbi:MULTISPECIES: hypothetical protein [Clostridium]|jgi:hypothetical protein|uniref:Uncharacterized protein n=2 Tax=Clostridium beijerinckii TaxID=1520 RepID=A0AAE2RVS3_CLOBE|nr:MULTISPECIES: hypothetical protein [Clostridium]ABR33476.1 hypothetical protein Cbei_1296 [Clostridium beijerinckii NCIMB 8052]AIU04843.1 hypothetical protein Cbs_1296 [Clostridium beijerinckii ATCC 35702]ALB47373.1 hypothetical protein X276_20015 [Clostridium beijerinckii NRRL B-598]AVK50349.1 hypothetical protein AXY43_21385 [Clostridium sp. MF28]MBC2456820.1 hypothetical protein [Clostridium beijerinckii]
MIRNKYESDYMIKKLGLNRMSENIFTDNSTLDELKSYLEENTYKYYNIRDKSVSGGKFLYMLTKDQVLLKSKKYKRYAVYESLAIADDRLILQGDIEIDRDFIMRASLSDIKGISNRIAMEKPVYNIYNYDLKEKRDPPISGLSKVIDYISQNSLIDMVVEFSLFEIPVGINQENIIIWELRNY